MKHTARTFVKNPGFTVTAVFIMALGIGGNTAMFTVIRAVLLKPLAYEDPEKLVRISGGATPSRLQEMRGTARSFSGIGAYTGQENLTLGGASGPEVVKAVRVSAGFLKLLGVEPKVGREFLPQEDAAGGAPVAMVSYDLWQRRFTNGGAAELAGVPYSIIGVLPPKFQFPSPGIDVWLTAPTEWPAMAPASRRLSPFLTIFGRLAPGVSLNQASAEARVIHQQYAAAHPAMLDAKLKAPLRITPMQEDLVANVRSMLWMLFAAVGFVLLIACANVAGLLLARAAGRSREFAVRAALGATRGRLIGQLMVESVLLSCTGGVLGVLLASWILRGVTNITAVHLPRAQEIHFDWMVFGFAAGLSIFTGLLFGLAPGLSASRPDLIAVLRTNGYAAASSAGRPGWSGLTARGPLVAVQIALSIVLLTGATLLIKSVSNLRGVDIGFNPGHLLVMRISLPPSHYDTDQKKLAFFDEFRRRAESLPGIRGLALALTMPMTGFPGTPVQDAARPLLRLNERPIEILLVTAPGYFSTMQVPLKRGRDFTERDNSSSQQVAIIDEGLARQLWPSYPSGQDPIGQRLMIGGVNAKPAEIVGIAGDVHQSLEKNVWPGSVYVSFAQNVPSSAMIAIRTEGDPTGFTRVVRDKVLSIDPEQPISDVRTMDELVEAGVGQRRLVVIVLGSFAGVALLLALTGIYGVISYSVTQRVQELGIRRALGAQTADIVALIMGQGLGLAAVGVVVGIAGALALTRVMNSLLFQISATDPVTFGEIAILFLVVAAVASYVPARRATRLDPMAALRLFI